MQKILSLKSVILAGVAIVALYCAITMGYIGGDVGVSKQTAAQGTGDMDSLARLDAYAKSGTSWGMSPFGRGAPLTEESVSKLKKPNTEWNTRTINGITYGFGEGNPGVVAMNEKALRDYWDNGGTFYMTQRAELYMKDFLASENLPILEEKCAGVVHLPANKDLNDVLYVDQTTGRKEFSQGFMNDIENALSELTDVGDLPKWRSCLSQNEYNEVYIPLRNQYLESTFNYRLRANQLDTSQE